VALFQPILSPAAVFCYRFAMDESPESSAELDALRIARWAALRRSAYHSRSYAIVAVGGCVIGAAQCAFDAVIRLRTHQGLIRPVLYMLAAVGLLILASYFCRVAAHYHRLAKQSNLPTPKIPPDFSTLSDGSQFAKNLNEM
jgi:hypothetical protein